MELKLKKYRRLLKERGEIVSEDDDGDDDDNDGDVVEKDKNHELTGESKIDNNVNEPVPQPQPTNSLLNFTEAQMNSNYTMPFVMNNHNNYTNENNFTSSSDQINSFSETQTKTNPISFIDSFSNTFQDHLSLQPDNSQPQTTQTPAELQNYFK